MYLSRINKAVVFWAGEIDWRVKVLTTKSDDFVLPWDTQRKDGEQVSAHSGNRRAIVFCHRTFTLVITI